MWSDPIVLCNETNGAMRAANGLSQHRDAVIQLISIISIVVQSAGTAYQRSDEEGDRVVKTVCELSRQALSELRNWPAEPVKNNPASGATSLPGKSSGAAGYPAPLAWAQSRALGPDMRGDVPGDSRHSAEPAITTLLLTPRELEVMRLIVRGLSNKEIASVLHLTEGTVKGYVSHLLSKLNVRSRTRAATVAIEQGWV